MERAGTHHGRGRISLGRCRVLAGLLGVLIANIPVSLLGGLVPAPLLALMPIYFWCLVRPDLMTPVWAFAIGLAGGCAVRWPAGRLDPGLCR